MYKIEQHLLNIIEDTEVAPVKLISNIVGGVILPVNRYKYKVAFNVSGFVIL